MIVIDIINSIFDILPQLILATSPACVFGGMGSGSQSGKLTFKKLVEGLDVDLKNLLKFKSQIRVTEDEYLNMIKTMKVKLEKDKISNPTKEYKISISDKELINLAKYDPLKNIKEQILLLGKIEI